MTQLEQTKYNAINTLKNLCARCSGGVEHSCPVGEVIGRIEQIQGIPVIVNDRLRHVVFSG